MSVLGMVGIDLRTCDARQSFYQLSSPFSLQNPPRHLQSLRPSSSSRISSVWKTPPVTLRLLPQSSDIFNHDLLLLKDAVPGCHLSPE